MDLLDLLREKLDGLGWATWGLKGKDEAEFANELLNTARFFGLPIPLRVGEKTCQRLQPVRRTAARRNSLSALYSLGEFPLHTDTAHWVTPCRFVFLACICPGETPRNSYLLDTRGLSLTKDENELLRCVPLRVVNGRNSFFSTMLSSDRPFVRCDPGCMKSVTSDGDRALGIFNRNRWRNDVIEIAWETGKALVIDNWRTMHGRNASVNYDSDRTLLRVLVK